MPYEIDDQGLRVIGYNEPIQFYDPDRNLRQEIYLQEDGSLAIGSLSVGTPTSGGNDLPDGGDAEFRDLTVTGDLTVGAGDIAGWQFEPGHLYSGTGENQAGMMPGTYPFYAGASSPASAAFHVTQGGALTATSATITGTITATAGTIGGWTATSTTLHSASNVVLDAGNKAIYVNDTTFGNAGVQLEYNAGTPRAYIGDGDQRYFQFDGTNVEIGGSLIVRGQIETSVFSYQAIQAHAGSLLVTISSGRLLNDATTVAAPTTFDLDIEDPAYAHTQLFSSGDILRLRKADGTQNWVEVSSVTDNTTYYTYTCTLSDGSATTFNAGTTVVDYGQSGDGYLYMSSDDSEGPFYSVRSWETNPWTAGNVTENARLGNMRNAFGTGANDRFGLGVGDYSSGNYLSYNAETAGEFIIKAGDDVVTLDSDGITINTATLSSANKIKLEISGSTGAEIFAYNQSVGGGALAGDRFQLDYAAGTTGILMMTDYTIINHDASPKPVYIAGGLTVGWESYNVSTLPTAPSDQDAHIRNDLRVGAGLYVGSTATDPDADDIYYDGDLRPVRGGTAYTGTVLIDSGEATLGSSTTLTTSYQTLCSSTITVPTGGGYLVVWGRVHVDQDTYAVTHIEARITVDGTQEDYARVRAIDVSNVEYNLPVHWVGSVSAGSIDIDLDCRQNVSGGSFDATSSPRTVLFYALYA